MPTHTSTARSVRPALPGPAPRAAARWWWEISTRERAPGLFTMLVFNRGLHCPVCHAQLSEPDRRFDELAGRGIDVVSISGETKARATRMRDEWKLEKLPLAYGLTEPQMREWGLFVSRAIKDDEPAVFNEPAIF